MLLDLAQLAFHNLLCILGVAEDKSAESIRSLDGDALGPLPIANGDNYLEFGDRDPGESMAFGYAGVETGDGLNLAAVATAEATAADHGTAYS